MSQSWRSASPGDRKRYAIIGQLLSGCPKLIESLFHPDEPELSAPAEELLDNPYSSGEKVLIRVALDIWSGSGQTALLDLNRLDSLNLRRAIEAFLSARSI